MIESNDNSDNRCRDNIQVIEGIVYTEWKRIELHMAALRQWRKNKKKKYTKTTREFVRLNDFRCTRCKNKKCFSFIQQNYACLCVCLCVFFFARRLSQCVLENDARNKREENEEIIRMNTQTACGHTQSSFDGIFFFFILLLPRLFYSMEKRHTKRAYRLAKICTKKKTHKNYVSAIIGIMNRDIQAPVILEYFNGVRVSFCARSLTHTYSHTKTIYNEQTKWDRISYPSMLKKSTLPKSFLLYSIDNNSKHVHIKKRRTDYFLWN